MTTKPKAKNLPTKLIAWDKLHPNPWNPNKMDDRTYQATRESLMTYGWVVPLTVRDHPDIPGEFQILGGEHRWKLAGPDEMDLGSCPCVTLGEIGDTEARKITLVLNQGGEPDGVLLGSLLKELVEAEGEAARNALRYDDAEFKHLLDLANEDWDKFKGGDGNGAGGGGADGWTTIPVRVPDDFMQVWADVRERVPVWLAEHDAKALHEDDKIANGQVIELLAAEWLARLE